MTQDEIIDYVKRVGLGMLLEVGGMDKCLEAFANLIEAKATEKANARTNASWALMCKKMVEAEREACAKVADEYAEQVLEHNFSKLIAHNIRQRGQDSKCKYCTNGCAACDARKVKHDLL